MKIYKYFLDECEISTTGYVEAICEEVAVEKIKKLYLLTNNGEYIKLVELMDTHVLEDIRTNGICEIECVDWDDDGDVYRKLRISDYYLSNDKYKVNKGEITI